MQGCRALGGVYRRLADAESAGAAGGRQFLIALTATADGKTPVGAIGTGPFQVTGFNNGVLALTANENCWQGRPFVDAIEIRVHRPVRDQWLDLSVGRADVVEVPAEQCGRHSSSG